MGLQAAPAPPQPRQQLYRLVPVEQDSVTGGLANIDPNQPLYQIAHPPMQPGVGAAGGLQGFSREQLSRIVVQSPQSGFVVGGGLQHLQQGFGGAAQGVQGNPTPKRGHPTSWHKGAGGTLSRKSTLLYFTQGVMHPSQKEQTTH